MTDSAIPMVNLSEQLPENEQNYQASILENEIKDIEVEHIVIREDEEVIDVFREDYRTIYLFIQGSGKVLIGKAEYEVVPEAILLPNIARQLTISATEKQGLHYVKIISRLTEQDRLDLQEFPARNTQEVYCTTFKDCQSYSEPIKSPDTVSRTILPSKYIPRIAMGTVQTQGPDEVGAHKHPMLEQLFLGLAKNNCTVYADEAKVNFPQYAVLHIPLGSIHSVSVEKDETLYYVWMDFFLDKSGENWLETHIVDEVNRS